MKAALSCPDRDQLERLVLGILDDEEASPQETHVECCPACLGVIRTLRHEDSFVQTVRTRAAADAPPYPAVDDARISHLCRLRPEVLAALRPEGSTPAGSVTADMVTLPQLRPPEQPDALGRLGPYHIQKVLGTGGMGIVYLAQQHWPQRLVALKMALARTDRGRMARFLREAEAIARLEHPNIVPVYEAGEQDGQPYFTMQYLEGGSLAQKLARNPLPHREAADLLRMIAVAVHHAHEHGIIHRDLKPGNVLLTGTGVPKVSDFGLARQMQTGDSDTVPGFATVSGALLGTPSYMAPEQARGKVAEVGPAADIYALGAILYECLAARPPFKAATVLETLDQVRTRDPIPPSRLQPGVPRDLQTICMKCLQKEPGKRYTRASDLAEDLGRFLEGQPIRARPVGLGERLVKWVRRRPALAGLLAVCGVFVGAVVAGLLVHDARMRSMVVRAEAGESAALQERETAAHNYETARDALNRILGRIERLRLGDVPQLKELQRGQLEDALAFYQEIIGRQPAPDPASRRDFAQAHARTARLQLILNRKADASKNYQRVLDLLDDLPDESITADDLNLQALGHEGLATLASHASQWPEVERHQTKALELRQRLVAQQPDNPDWQNGLAIVEHMLATNAYLRDRRAEAAQHYQNAISLRTNLVRLYPGRDEFAVALAENYINLGLVLPTAETLLLYPKAESLLRSLVERHPPGGESALSLAALLVNWGLTLRDQGQPVQALKKIDQAVDLAEAVYLQEPHHRDARSRAFMAHGARAQVLEALGRHADAVRDWDRVVALDDGPRLLTARLPRALALARAGEHVRATAEAKILTGLPDLDGDDLYNVATVYALAVGPARTDTRLEPAKRQSLAALYAAEAIALLRRLETMGYFKERLRIDHLKKDPNFQALHAVADFQSFVNRLGG